MIMQKFNYHTHTYRCKHAKGTDEEYVLKAIEAGYTVLGFSDHAPYRDYPSDRSHMDFEQLDDYIDSINYLKEKTKSIKGVKINSNAVVISVGLVVVEKMKLAKRTKINLKIIYNCFQLFS